MSYIYHFCAQHQKNAGEVNYLDGIADMKNEILTMEDLGDLKKEIALIAGVNTGKEITVLSLSKLK